MVHLITINGKVTELGENYLKFKDTGGEVLAESLIFLPGDMTEVLSIGDEIEVEVHFEKAVTVVDSVDDLPPEATQ